MTDRGAAAITGLTGSTSWQWEMALLQASVFLDWSSLGATAEPRTKSEACRTFSNRRLMPKLVLLNLWYPPEPLRGR